jgi:hypothetical protein
MPIVSALLMGTGMGVCVLGTSLIGLARSNRNNEENNGIRKSSHVTEILQVDMVDRKIVKKPSDLSTTYY